MSTASDRRQAHPRSLARRQRGVVLVSIMAVMFVTLLIASSLINHFLVNESVAIERNLIEVRAYWAQIGQFDYLLSRVMEAGKGVKPGELADLTDLVIQKAENPLPLSYVTPDGVSFKLQMETTVTDLGDGGRMTIEVHITAPTGDEIPALSGIENSLPTLTATVCVGDRPVANRTASDSCVDNLNVLGNYGLPTVLAMRMQAP
ncbi:MAG: hypothetical protein H6980_06775 [Gammaproteobacteria bacterium]|nr:hypothetical protein [Gammaproteobacteria bacterium]